MLKKLTHLALAAIFSLVASVALADSQQSSIYLKLNSVLTGSGDLQTPTSQFLYDKVIDLANGTGADQANQVWSDTRTLTTGANETLDLNGTLTNAVGSSVTFTKVKVMLIKNKGTTTLSIGGAASNGFISFVGSATDVIKIPPGGILLLTAPDASGFAATAATADQLKVANSAGASVDYDIVLIGVN